MSGIWIFGGTGEGRELAAFCCRNRLPATISVATEYGEQLLPEDGGNQVIQGRMDQKQMQEYLSHNAISLVIDATHPYAVEVTENIQKACEAQAVAYIRLLRKSVEDFSSDYVVMADSAAQASAYLAQKSGNILLTTGSKELSAFCEVLDVNRLYPRILPSNESINLCQSMGVPLKNCIAMQGPFTEEINLALLNQFHCKYLVTKESGAAGGFQEKLAACRKAGARAVVIGRPAKEKGLDFNGVCQYLIEKYNLTIRPEIDIVGIGMGTEDTITQAAKQIIDQADALIGGKRMLAPYVNKGKVLFDSYDPDAIREFIKQYISRQTGQKRIAVLMSGDVGFYSGAKRLLTALKDYKVSLHPGISSVVYMAAKIGVSWQDMELCSLHGRRENVLAKIKHQEKVFVVVGKGEEINSVCSQLVACGMKNIQIYVGEALSYPQERIWQGGPEDAIKEVFNHLCVALFMNPDYKQSPVSAGIADEDFVRGKVPMTKEEVRTISIGKLQLTRDAVVYDIGAGTGSVSIQTAMAAEDGMVYAVERRPEAAALIKENARKFGVTNIEVVEGIAPGALQTLPMPTHAFIGGSSGNLKEIVSLLRQKNPGIQIVINGISLETIAEMTAFSKTYDMELVQVTVAKVESIGNYRLMKGQNPVMIGTIKGN